VNNLHILVAQQWLSESQSARRSTRSAKASTSSSSSRSRDLAAVNPVQLASKENQISTNHRQRICAVPLKGPCKNRKFHPCEITTAKNFISKLCIGYVISWDGNNYVNFGANRFAEGFSPNW